MQSLSNKTPVSFCDRPDLEFADDAVLVTPSHCFSHLSLETFNTVASLLLKTSFIMTKVMGCGVNFLEAKCQPLIVS